MIVRPASRVRGTATRSSCCRFPTKLPSMSSMTRPSIRRSPRIAGRGPTQSCCCSRVSGDVILDQLQREGFAIIPEVLSASLTATLTREIDASLPNVPAAGVRGLVQKVTAVAALARSSALRALVEPPLGAEARLVRSIYFSKSKDANWQVAWHQDLAIAVRERFDVAGFVSWSAKDGVPHVQPPVVVLERMLTVRVHLDAADESNGALWV